MMRPEASLPRDALEAWTLLLLRGRPTHGYELSKRLGERGCQRPGPRVYRLLRELEHRDLARSSWTSSSGVGPDRRVYRLTSKGTRQLHHAASILQRRCETLRLFLEHYAQALDKTSANEWSIADAR